MKILLLLLIIPFAVQAITPEPTTISVPPKTTDILTLSWNANPGTTASLPCNPDCFFYTIYSSPGLGGTLTPIWSGTAINVAMDTVDLGLVDGSNKICFRVRAGNQHGLSGYSEAACTVIIMGKPRTPLGVQVVYP